jgi:hypothetical protein
MTRSPKLTLIVFGLLGGLLLLDLLLPIANLLIHADWSSWIASLREPGASKALRISALTSSVTVVIMTVLGVPLGYLTRARSPPIPAVLDSSRFSADGRSGSRGRNPVVTDVWAFWNDRPSTRFVEYRPHPQSDWDRSGATFWVFGNYRGRPQHLVFSLMCEGFITF